MHRDRYLDYLRRIGDDLDGFHDPMTKAIWHWARAYPEALDEDFKHALRSVVRAAKCTKQRDLDRYLSDYGSTPVYVAHERSNQNGSRSTH